tara:strand:- start:1014 stop:2180 length:1167 start_codon:yes stop_codon:yes gene_type:complete
MGSRDKELKKSSFKVLSVFGTRPEAIKMAPLILNLTKDPRFSSFVCVTAQHRQMLDQVLDIFEIKPDFDLNIMKENQSLEGITSGVLNKLGPVLKKVNPDLVLVHGDTSTTFASALASFYQKIPIGHVEAGLRTHDIYSPWPEEANRKLTASISNLHFAPTNLSELNLLEEGISKSKIIVTGNTVVDALILVLDKISNNKVLKKDLESDLNFLDKSKKIVLVTGHRRENFDKGLDSICEGLSKISRKNEDCQIVYPVHPNPLVQEKVKMHLEGLKNILLIDPLPYLSFCLLMTKSYLIISDSGGIQEEAPTLNIPILVTRNITERPEAIESGIAKLVGTNSEDIFSEADRLLKDERYYNKMRNLKNPYGDGNASKEITDFIYKKLSLT